MKSDEERAARYDQEIGTQIQIHWHEFIKDKSEDFHDPEVKEYLFSIFLHGYDKGFRDGMDMYETGLEVEKDDFLF